MSMDCTMRMSISRRSSSSSPEFPSAAQSILLFSNTIRERLIDAPREPDRGSGVAAAGLGGHVLCGDLVAAVRAGQAGVGDLAAGVVP
jgi:hypothetical protein